MHASPSNVEWHMAGLARNPLEPCADCRIGRQIESSVCSGVCVAIERNVRDRVALAGEPVAPRKVSLHHAERGIALCMPLRYQMPPLLEFLFCRKRVPESRDRDIG